MRRLLLPIATVAIAGLLASCAGAPRVVPVAAAPTPEPSVPNFAGYGNLDVPARLADGSYVTPNRGVSAAGAVWHMRAGLNVAALACRGPEEAALITNYNALLKAHADEFAAAYKTLSRQHGDAATFDAAMTRLYNYYALPPATPGLCAAAQAVLADAAQLPVGGIAGFAPAALATLERPFTTVFAKQEAWLASRNGQAPPPATLIAAASAPVAIGSAQSVPAPAPTPRPAPQRLADSSSPLLRVDPDVFRMP